MGRWEGPLSGDVGRKAAHRILLPMIQEMLADAGAVLTQLDGIAFGSDQDLLRVCVLLVA